MKRFWWHDARLRYPAVNASKDGSLLVSKEMIWYPSDVGIVNSFDPNDIDAGSSMVKVTPSGDCYWAHIFDVSLTCVMRGV